MLVAACNADLWSSVFMLFYLCIQIGGFSSLATTMLELHYGFGIAFLFPLCIFVVGLCILISCKKSFVIRPPDESVLLKALAVVRMAIQHGRKFEPTKPSYQSMQTHPISVYWDDTFVDELRRTAKALQVFAFLPFYFLAYTQMLTNFIHKPEPWKHMASPTTYGVAWSLY